MTLDLVAFDIETTGFTVTDEITVAGFALEMGARVFYQTGGRPANPIERDVREQATHNVHVSAHESEAKLLEAMAAFVTARLAEKDVLLIAYNGETWRGGFDLPFLRTRHATQDVAWPFTDLPYADVFPVVTNRFNTTRANGADSESDQDDGAGDTDTQQDLAGVYTTLCSGRFGEIDPFTDSGEAVTAFERGDFTDLVCHNVADILRTRALGRLAQRYCSKSDFSVKSLTAATDG
jgi:hypothetical protein